MEQLILRLLGKKEVKRILNLWIKDQVNIALEQNTEIVLDQCIWLQDYLKDSPKFKEVPELDEPFDVDRFFEFIGNRI